MSYQSIEKWFGRLPNRLNPFWISRELVRRLQSEEHLAQRRQMSALSSQVVSLRLAEKRKSGAPLHVVFLCHMPGAWGTYDALVRRLMADKRHFKVTLIAAPYHHSTFGDAIYHDGGMAKLFEERGLPFVHALDKKSGRWLNPAELAPDFFFFQTPYDEFYPGHLRSNEVSSYAIVCYAPYYGADILPETDGIYAPDFFNSMSLWFAPSEKDVRAFYKYRPGLAPLVGNRIRVVGLPRVQSWREYQEGHPKPEATGRTTFLWTPRWNSEARFCTFFKYKETLMKIVERNPKIHLIFRPHPLMFQTMRQKRDLSEKELKGIQDWFAFHPNAEIDENGDFQPSFLRADAIISDTSSMLLNFAITGKPVIHTHGDELKLANLGEDLSESFYGVDSARDLEVTIDHLLERKDPLQKARSEIVDRLFNSQNAVENIINELLHFGLFNHS